MGGTTHAGARMHMKFWLANVKRKQPLRIPKCG